ncbi:MAG: nuclear transport factor 2 family protein [Rubrobacter sp.]|nr:nuclear transport factor 2 family protein [Rubrobacter sp.]
MTEQDNLQTIHRVYAAFQQGDVEGVISMLTDDVTWSTPGPPDVIPYAGLRQGHDQVTGYFEAFGQAAETTAFEPQKYFAHDDMVVVLGHYTFSVVKTGKVVDNDWVHTFVFSDGKISVFEGYEDSAAVVAAFTAGPN